MSHFHSVTVTNITRETKDSVSVSLKPNHPDDDFSYASGQYLTFNIHMNGEELHRSYSLCSAPNESEMRIAVKKVEGGRVSGFFNEILKEGDVLKSMLPAGNFILPQTNEKTHFVFFAAGSGITPIISLLKSVLQTEPNHQVSLFFGNSSADTIIFKKELEALELSHDQLKVYHLLTDGSSELPIFSGRINFGKTSELLYNFCSDNLPKEFFICGPSEMMNSVQNALVDANINSENIHLEYFAAPTDSVPTKAIDVTEERYEGMANVKVILDDDEFEFQLNSTGASILNAVLDQGEDAPYSCRGGVCTTCKAKVLKGKVHMDSNFALTDGEIANGYILTCQSHPNSPDVEVSYDE